MGNGAHSADAGTVKEDVRRLGIETEQILGLIEKGFARHEQSHDDDAAKALLLEFFDGGRQRCPVGQVGRPDTVRKRSP